MIEKIKHLEFIQQIINRMANNSFLLKGWTITVVSALFVLAVKDSNASYFLLAYFPVIFFWFIDGYFLWQERLYRKLYDQVRIKKRSTGFYMETDDFKKNCLYSETFFSKTLLVFYLPLIATMLVLMYYFI
ncbi:MAG: hypothetical protein U0946_05835 [Patescibacteria group bacterium]|nr:hypothetical protein [Patescibacteria group bacterium]